MDGRPPHGHHHTDVINGLRPDITGGRTDGALASGGAYPSDMNAQSKREKDPIAFQIHFATGA